MVSVRIFCIGVTVLFLGTVGSLAQTANLGSETDDDGIPVLIKHLPDWESVRERAVFARSPSELRPALGERPFLDGLDFAGGTEAVTATYDAGKLLIIEYATPQASIDADVIFKKAVAADATTLYRRIGNYNAFVFDVRDTASANALLDQVQYEKDVQWLGENPFIISAERAFVLQITDIFISTVIWIILGIVIALVSGGIAGWMYFRRSEQRRAAFSTFSDAGGMTRLNLDGFTPEIAPERLLKH